MTMIFNNKSLLAVTAAATVAVASAAGGRETTQHARRLRKLYDVEPSRRINQEENKQRDSFASVESEMIDMVEFSRTLTDSSMSMSNGDGGNPGGNPTNPPPSTPAPTNPGGNPPPSTPAPTAAPSTPTPTLAPQPETMAPSSSPTACFVTQTREEFLLEELAAFNETLLMDPATSQGSAFSWLNGSDVETTNCLYPTVVQRYALATFYFATEGDSWTDYEGWLSADDECTWKGIDCGDGEEVSTIDLNRNNLGGTLPNEELGALTSLEALIGWENTIAGPIPTSIFKAPLSIVDMEFNELTGNLPSEIWTTPSLTKLRVSFNELEGEGVPSEIGGLTMLQDLWMAENMLTGSLPSELGLLADLELMFLYENKLTGVLPSEIGEISSLKEVQLYGNDLSGSIPSEFFDNKSLLEVLRLDQNDLTGTIPAGLSTATSLEDLRVYSNSFTGPLSFSNLTKLEKILVGGNSFTGSLTDDFSEFSNLDFFAVRNNSFTGPIPSTLFDVPCVRLVYMQNNQFTGAIPSNFQNADCLKDLYINNNMLTGTVPSIADGTLGSFTEFVLGGNELTGTMPASICALRNVSLEDICVKPDDAIECDCCSECSV